MDHIVIRSYLCAHFTVALHAGELDSLDVFNTLLAQFRQQFLLSEKLFAQIVRYRPALSRPRWLKESTTRPINSDYCESPHWPAQGEETWPLFR